MQKQKMNRGLLTLLSIVFFSILMWYLLPKPVTLTSNAWHTFIIFLATIACLITNPFPMGVITLLTMLVCVITSAITLDKVLNGFSQSVVWLVVCAFFIARTVINTNLGTRIAYIFISKFGKSPIGVAYSLILTELVIAPMIPSATSRGGGIIYPIAKSAISGYASNDINVSQNRIGKFFTMICMHSNIITSTMFLTAMAGNPVAQKLAGDYGVELTWSNWAYAAVFPGIISLILLPYIVKFFCTIPNDLNNEAVIEHAKDGLKALGKMTINEIITACTFMSLIVLWVFEKQVGINATTTAIMGVCILLLTGVLSWNDILNEKPAWDIFIWFAILVTIANSLSEQQVTLWAGNIISGLLTDFTPILTAAIICIGLFFGHYMFASITVYFTAMYGVFLKTFLSIGLSPLPSAYALIIIIMLSSGLTHYGISSAPVFFSGGYMTVKEWWRKSFGIAFCATLVWVIICTAWWKVIGWI